MNVDGRSFLWFAIKTIAILAVLVAIALLGVAAVWRWPANIVVTALLCFGSYCAGWVARGERDARPVDTIAPLPKATWERGRRG